MEGGQKYTAQERQVLQSLFASSDVDRTGKIHINQLPGLLAKLGKTEGKLNSVFVEWNNILEETLQFYSLYFLSSSFFVLCQTPSVY